MEDIIDIIVTETTNTIEITAQPNDEIIDVNIIDNREDIVLNVTPTVVEININSLSGNFGVNWGDIDGTLSNQTDLQNALNLKADLVDGKVPSSQLPSYVDDIVEVATYSALPTTGETGKIYVVLDTNLIYRWSGSAYIEIKDSSAVWGAITGTLSSQTDLQNALNAKFDDPTGDTTQYIAGDGSLITFPVAGQAGTLVREVRNTTGATLTKGTIVYISGATGNKPTVSKAIATGDSTSAQTFGMCQANISNNSNGYVVCVGDITGLDTSALSEGVQLYLSSTTAGAYTTTKQLAPAHLVYIGVVTRSHPTQGQIEVKIQNGYELDEIHDVAISSVANNDGIFYESSTSLWKNKSIATVLGYTPADGANYLPLTGGTLSGILRVDSALRIKSGSANGILLETYNTNELRIRVTPTSTTFDMNLVFPSASKTYTFPNTTGTIALTSDLSSYQPLLTNPVTGTGTSGIVAKFNGTSTITDSIIYDNGTRISIGADVTTSNKFTAVASTTSSYAVVAQASGAANGFWATLSGTGEIFRGQTSGGSYFIINNGGNAFLNGNLNVGDFASTSYRLNVVGTANFTGALTGTSASFSGDVTLSGTNPRLYLTDTDNNPDYFISNTDGTFTIYDVTNSTSRFTIGTTGNGTFGGNLTVGQIIRSGGLSTQFLKADGSIDSNTYLTTGTAASTYLPLTGGTLTNPLTISTSSGQPLILNSTDVNLNQIIFNRNGTTFGKVYLYYNDVSNIPDMVIGSYATGGRVRIESGNNATALTLDGSQNAQFVGTITTTQGIFNGSAPERVRMIRTTIGSWDLSISSDNRFSIYDVGSSLERISILSGGNVGIGVTNPNGTYGKLSVAGGISLLNDNNGKLEIGRYSSGASDSYIKLGANSNSLRITNNTDIADLLFLTNSGNLGLGVLPSTSLDTTQIRTVELGTIGNFISGYVGSSVMYLGTNAYLSSTGWRYARTGSASGQFDIGGGGFRFLTAASGTAGNAITYIASMTMTSGGYFKASNTGSYISSTGLLHEFNTDQNDTNVVFRNTASTITAQRAGLDVFYANSAPNSTAGAFYQGADNSGGSRTLRFEVRSNGGIANYQANDSNLSDERTKKEISPLESYWNKFKAMEIVKFKYKDQTHNDFNIGVIAQQVESVAPEFVDIDGWGDTKKDEVPLKSIYTADLYHASIGVLKEAMAKIETLEAEIKTLKNK